MSWKRLWIANATLGLFCLAGCGERPAAEPGEANPPITGEDVRHQLRQAADTAVEYSKQKAGEIQQTLEKRLSQANDEIAELEKKLTELSGEAKVRAEEELEKLRGKRDELRKKVDNLGEASGKAWQELKAGVDSAWKDLKSAVDNASQQFSSDKP